MRFMLSYAEVPGLIEWAHQNDGLRELRRNVLIREYGRLPLIKGYLVLALDSKVNFGVCPGRAAQGASGIWYENLKKHLCLLHRSGED